MTKWILGVASSLGCLALAFAPASASASGVRQTECVRTAVEWTFSDTLPQVFNGVRTLTIHAPPQGSQCGDSGGVAVTDSSVTVNLPTLPQEPADVSGTLTVTGNCDYATIDGTVNGVVTKGVLTGGSHLDVIDTGPNYIQETVQQATGSGCVSTSLTATEVQFAQWPS